MCKFKNSYVSLKAYNKNAPSKIVETYLNNNNYESQKTNYPNSIDNKKPWLLSNFSSSGVVATNPSAYNVAVEAPGLSWV